MSKIIELSHALKVELLKAIQCGKLDLDLFSSFDDYLTPNEIKEKLDKLYKLSGFDCPEVIDNELDRLYMLNGKETCQRLKRLGLCHQDKTK